ncbi:MAG: hypothetical protein EON88_28165, partial [Brevundimonas sp.]
MIKTPAQIQEAIETWRSLAFKPGLDEDEAETMERCEQTILRTTVTDSHHAAAMCDVVLYNMDSGGRTDRSESKALAALRFWIARSPTRVQTDGLSL